MKRLNGFLLIVLMLVVLGFQPKATTQAKSMQAPNQGDAIDPIEYQVFLPIIFQNASNQPTEEEQIENLLLTQINGIADQMVGAIVEGLFVSPVQQQPENDPHWISNTTNTLTSLREARATGAYSLTAFNTLAGAKFFDIPLGQTILILMGDGTINLYVVDEILQFQACDPGNPESDFINLETLETISSAQLKHFLYDGSRRLVFQTNLSQDGIADWGLFVVTAFLVTD